MKPERETLRIFGGSLLLSYAVVGVLAMVQFVAVYHEVAPRLFVIPAVVATIFGLMLGYLRHLRRQLRLRSEQFRAVADFAEEWTYLLDGEGRVVYCSPACERLTGHPPEHFLADSRRIAQLFEPENRDTWNACHEGALCRDEQAHPLDLGIRHADGSRRVLRHFCAPLLDDEGRPIGTRATNFDVTLLHVRQEELHTLAHRDALTGLGNRKALEAMLGERVSGKEAKPFAILFLDLDRFKYINDVYGHALGDEILGRVASRLRDESPPCCHPFRFGGDEFVVVLDDSDPDAHLDCARNARRLLAQPVRVRNLEFEVGVSIGIARWPEHGRDVETLVKNADLAMYEAKRRRLGHCVFEPEMARVASDLMTYEQMLRAALQRGELVAWYQPVMDLRRQRMIGAEALVRWRHPEQGLITPNRFVPMAEDTGLILPLGREIFRQAVQQLARWRQAGHELRMGINVSIRQLEDESFIDWALTQCAEAGLDPSMVVLEITESVLMENLAQVRAGLSQAHAAGFQIALDDFGTGFSSIQYLADLPVTILKLDRQMVAGLKTSPRHRRLVGALVEMGNALELDLVGEGIEDADTADFLARLPRVYGQGYHFSPPAPAAEIEERFLADR